MHLFMRNSALVLSVVFIVFLSTSLVETKKSKVPSTKYLVRGNASFVLTQFSSDGSLAKATVYISDTNSGAISVYKPTVNLPGSQNPAASPSLGSILYYERIAYCFGKKQSTPQMLYVNDTLKQVITTTFSPTNIKGTCENIVIADVDGDGHSEVVMLTGVSRMNMEVVVLANTGHVPTEVKILYKLQLKGAYLSYKYRLVGGKFKQNDNTTDVVAISAFDYSTSKVFLWVLGMSGTTKGVAGGTFQALVSKRVMKSNVFSAGSGNVPMDAVVAYLNNDNGGGTSTLVLAYRFGMPSSMTINIEIASYQISSVGKLVKAGKKTTSTVSVSAAPINITLSAGGILSTNAMESVVMAMAPYSGPFHVYILKPNKGQLDGHTPWHITGRIGLHMVNHQISAKVLPQTAQVVLVDSYMSVDNKGLSIRKQDLYILEVQGTKLTAKLTKPLPTGNLYTYGYVNTGNMIGINMWLGPESIYTANKVQNVLMKISAPPIYTPYINLYDGNPSIQWTSSLTNSTQVSMSSTTGWTKSDTLGLSMSLMSLSASASFEKSTSNMVQNDYANSVEFQQELSISTTYNDILLVRQMTYKFISRDVFIGNKLSGQILIVQPVNTYSNSLAITTGSYLYLNQTHAIGDLRTYPFTPPTAWTKTNKLYSVTHIVSFGVSSTLTVGVTNMVSKGNSLTREQSNTVTAEANLEFPFEVGPVSGSIGGSYSHSSQYMSSSVNSSETSISSNLAISISIPGLSTMSEATSAALEYQVSPYIYWSNTGIFHIDWTVGLPVSWRKFLNKPDPALLLPYHDPVYNGYTIQDTIFELYTTPRTKPPPGQSVIITVPIHNYSFRVAYNTLVEFYWTTGAVMPPKLTNTKNWKHIGSQTIPSIGEFMKTDAFTTWMPPKKLKSAVLIVKIVPNKGIDFDTQNNLGYSVWPQGPKNLFNTVMAQNKLAKLFEKPAKSQKNTYPKMQMCSGKRFKQQQGSFYNKKKCQTMGGKCCSQNSDGTEPVSTPDHTKGLCGFCFNGQIKTVATPYPVKYQKHTKPKVKKGKGTKPPKMQKKVACSGKRFKQLVGMFYNKKICQAIGGKCCSRNSDGTEPVSTPDETKGLCGFCFNGQIKTFMATPYPLFFNRELRKRRVNGWEFTEAIQQGHD